MLTALSTTLYRISSWKTLVLALVLYIPFPAYLFKNLETRMNTLAGEVIGPIDLLMGFNPERIMYMVATYGPVGRSVYAFGELTTDVAYPIIYSYLLATILSLLFRNRADKGFRVVNVLPLLILGFDLMENVCIVALLKSYPNLSFTLASICSILTNLKWAMFLIVTGFIIYGLILLAISRQTRQVI